MQTSIPPSALPPLCVVIPSWRGQSRLPAVLDALAACFADWPGFAVLAVDDGSQPPEDPVWLRQLAQSRPWLGVLGLRRNLGQRLATLIGLDQALKSLPDTALVATMDDDGGHPPEALRAAAEHFLERGDLRLLYIAPAVDIPIGEPQYIRKPWWRRVGTAANTLFFHHYLGMPAGVPVGSFRLFRADLARRALDQPCTWPYLSAMLLSSIPCVPGFPVTVAAGQVAAYRYSPTRQDQAARPGSSYSPLTLLSLYARLFWHWGPGRPLARRIGTELVFVPRDYGVGE